ncbi:MAG TPA: hypothetical protein PKA27_13540 [Fimbriimonadaceae bacterium]|nr:hypothetical protein [Fimbriimonadaceae bacterium]
MKHVPQDIEALMWAVAENPTPDALNDFQERFPDLSVELFRRVRMVSAFKSTRPQQSSIPRFHGAPSRGFQWRPATTALAAFALVALSVGSYVVTKGLVGSEPEVPQPVIQASGSGTRSSSPPEQMNPRVPPNLTHSQPGEVRVPEVVVEPPKAPERFTVKMSGLALSQALFAVGQQCRVQFELAPGMSDEEVEFNLIDLTLDEILGELGRKYGFTALPQEAGRYLIVPVSTDNSAGMVGKTHPEADTNP